MLPAKARSGLPIIDETWGGLYRGGAYLLYGRAQSGNRLLALQLARAAVEAGDTCLFVSPSPPEVLADRAARLGLRVEPDGERLRLLHVAPVSDDPADDELEQALTDLTSLIRDYAPSRLVIDDFEPFTRFQAFERFANAFFTLLDRLTGSTLILAMHARPNQASEHLAEFVQAQMTGVIELAPGPADAPGACTLVLRPSRFHAEGARAQNWDFRDPVRPQPSAAREPLVLSPEPLVPTWLPSTEAARVLAVAGAMDAPDPSGYDLPGIYFFDFEDGDAPSLKDPAPPRPRRPDTPPPDTPAASDFPPGADPFEYALVQPGPLAPPDAALFSTLPTFLSQPAEYAPGDSVPRRQFIQAFRASSLLYETAAHPFLVLALRMAPASPAAQNFPLVVRGMRAVLGDAYVLLSDLDRLRLAALLPGYTPESGAHLFSDLKQFLYDVTPEADLTFEETSAALFPGGQPFQSVEAFLAQTFDG